MKTKNIIFNKWIFLLVFSGLSSVYLISCSDEEKSGPPVINDVRITDPAKRDSTFSRAFPGALIVVEGQNFVNVKGIELNNVSIVYNPNYVTPNSIIFTIPSNLPLKGEDPALPNTIRIITASGEVTHDFTFLSPTPKIGVFKFQPPATVSRPIEIIGSDFFVVNKIVFLSPTNDVLSEVTDFTVNNTHDVISFTIPEGGVTDGSIVVISESGSDTSDYKSNPFPEFLKLSDDIQIPGAPITITGKYFLFVNKVVLPGGVEIPKEELTFNALNTQIEFTMPDNVTDAGKVQLVTEFGDVIDSPITFNDWNGVVMDWDGKGYTWNKETSELANGIKPPVVGTEHYAHFLNSIDANADWWWDPLTLVMSFDNFPTPTDVVDATPISKIGLAFNYYTVNDWNDGGYWRMQFGWNSGNSYDWKPWTTQPLTKGKWTTVTIPLSTLINSTGQTNWGQVKSAFDPSNNFLFFQFGNGNNSKSYDVNAFWDNVRFVKLP
jgi:hypothetical protein